MLRFALDSIEWIARGEKARREIPARIGRIRRVALLVGHLKGATLRIDTLLHRPRPRNNDREDRKRLSSEALQRPAFGQITGHLRKSKTCIQIAEAFASHQAERCVMWRRGVAVSALQAEIHRPAAGERV